MSDSTTELGERIRAYRSQKGKTQAALAAEASVSPGYMSELESGAANRPSGQVLMRLADALGVTIADLLGTTPAPPAVDVPAGLAEFARDRDLPEADVRMLAAIRFRGEQPRTARRWAMIYDSISSSRTLDE